MKEIASLVRFYYLSDTDAEKSTVLAWDDYEECEADLHAEHLIRNQIPFYRGTTRNSNGSLTASPTSNR